jgi:hypothetical protein
MCINIMLSILLGIIVSCILFYFLNIKNSALYRGPNSKIIKTNIYRSKNEKCFILEPKIYICPKN